jgi:hypothetical protein
LQIKIIYYFNLLIKKTKETKERKRYIYKYIYPKRKKIKKIKERDGRAAIRVLLCGRWMTYVLFKAPRIAQDRFKSKRRVSGRI